LGLVSCLDFFTAERRPISRVAPLDWLHFFWSPRAKRVAGAPWLTGDRPRRSERALASRHDLPIRSSLGDPAQHGDGNL